MSPICFQVVQPVLAGARPVWALAVGVFQAWRGFKHQLRTLSTSKTLRVPRMRGVGFVTIAYDCKAVAAGLNAKTDRWPPLNQCLSL